MSKYNFEKHRQNDLFIDCIKHWSICFDLSLRDIEKCVALYAFLYPHNQIDILTYFIILKVKKKDLYEKLLANDIEAHKEARELISKLIVRAETENLLQMYLLEIFYEWHNAHCTNFNEIEENFKQILEDRKFRNMNNKNLFKHYGNIIDVNIEN